jgi:hypothetical protein
MALVSSNTWKFIIQAFKSKIAAQFKCPIYSQFDEDLKSNQFIRIIPTGSSQVQKAVFLEAREYNMDCQFYFLRRKDSQFQNYVLNQVSILESLIHDNITLQLSDAQSTKAIDVTMGDLDLDVEVDGYESYFVAEWKLSCVHFGNPES